MYCMFYGYDLEYDDSCFVPTTITKFTAINVPVKGKTVLDLGCGIGPLAVYFAKNGAKSVTASDVYDKHIYYTKRNVAINQSTDPTGTQVDTIQSDLFENIDDKFDVIACDVSGIDRRVAEMTGWFPKGVPTADETGADIICRAIREAPYHLNKGGELYICTAQFSDVERIKEEMNSSTMMTEPEHVFTKQIPFSKILLENIGDLDPSHYTKKGSRYVWEFGLWKMKLI